MVSLSVLVFTKQQPAMPAPQSLPFSHSSLCLETLQFFSILVQTQRQEVILQHVGPTRPSTPAHCHVLLSSLPAGAVPGLEFSQPHDLLPPTLIQRVQGQGMGNLGLEA